MSFESAPGKVSPPILSVLAPGYRSAWFKQQLNETGKVSPCNAKFYGSVLAVVVGGVGCGLNKLLIRVGIGLNNLLVRVGSSLKNLLIRVGNDINNLLIRVDIGRNNLLIRVDIGRNNLLIFCLNRLLVRVGSILNNLLIGVGIGLNKLLVRVGSNKLLVRVELLFKGGRVGRWAGDHYGDVIRLSFGSRLGTVISSTRSKWTVAIMSSQS